MTYFPRCIGCASKGNCEELDILKGWAKSLSITTIKHTCKKRVSDFQPGDPILVFTVATGEWVDQGPDDGYIVKALFRGHFIQETDNPNKVIVYVAEGTKSESGVHEFKARNASGFVKAPRSRVQRLINGQRADATPCPRCGQQAGITGRCGNHESLDPKAKCAIKQAEQKEAA